MSSCDDYRELLWDYLYGLLEPDEHDGLRSHLTVCPACRDELDRAEDDQRLLAEVARVDVDVPPFIAPADDAPLPLPARRFAPTLAAFRPWMAAAAALLLAVVLPYAIYQRGLAQYQSAQSEAEGHLAEVRTEQRQLADDERLLVQNTRASQLRLQVLGPARYHADTANAYRVLTTDLAGHAVAAHVSLRVLGQAGEVLYEARDLASAGNLVVAVPAGLGVRTGSLEVTARSSQNEAEVHGSLNTAEPSLRTHLALDRPVYRPGDTVLFRSVTLDAFSLRPAPECMLKYRITDPRGKPVFDLVGRTQPGGIGSGAFGISAQDPLPGEYTLTVSDAQGRFPPQVRKFLVQVEDAGYLEKTLRLERSSYAPGETLQAELRLVRKNATKDPGRNLDVAARLEVDGRLVGQPVRLKTDASGAATLRVPLPSDLPSGEARLTVDIDNVGKQESVARSVAVVASGLSVDLFPEGGDLLAGVPNRVYFRVAIPAGRPYLLEGRVVNGDVRELARFRLGDREHGMGSFTLTPEAGQSYVLHLAGAWGKTAAVPLPPARVEGVALSVPHAVAADGEPIDVVLHRTGSAPRSLVVAAVCRGRLVAHEAVTLSGERAEVRLTPEAGTTGVVRVTAFDSETSRLRPVSERLVYRLPKQMLGLAVEADKKQYQPGDHVRLTVRGRNEQGDPAWLLVSVVDREALARAGDPLSRSLPAQFYLDGDVNGPEDLESAAVLLHDTPEACTALDGFLGTDGWRRFTPAKGQPAAATKSDESPILKLDNDDQAEDRLFAAVTAFEKNNASRRQELRGEEQRCAGEASAAAEALAAYQQRAVDYLRQGTRFAAVLLLGAGLVLLGVGLFRTWRGVIVRRPYYYGAAVPLSLGLAMGLTLGTGWTDVIRIATPPSYSPQVVQESSLPTRTRTDRDETVLQVAAERTTPASHLQLHGDLAAAKRPTGTAPAVLIARGVTAPDKPLPVRQYAFNARLEKDAHRETILWQPMVDVKNGTAELEFDLPRNETTFRILVQGHSISGRLGVAESSLESRRAGADKVP